MSDPRTITMVVTLPDTCPADWPHIGQILARHHHDAFIPHPVLSVHRNRLSGLTARWSRRDLLDVVRCGRAVHAAGGRLRRLDLHTQATAARTTASRRWWTWHELIARTTPVAKPWEHVTGDTPPAATTGTNAEARRRFEAQPRVLAMLAYNTYPAATHHLDPRQLAEFQAGEAVYVALHWHSEVVGDALVDPVGRLLQPDGPTIADRLRYLADATRVVHQLAPRDWLVSVRATATP
jgi:hypothetical protein